MRLPTPLLRGRLIKRYKRFLSDIALDDGREIIAHFRRSAVFDQSKYQSAEGVGYFVG